MIDLHTHTRASDGSFTPADLVRYAGSRGVSVLAITDHDSISGLAEAQREAGETGLTLVPGIVGKYKNTSLRRKGHHRDLFLPCCPAGIQSDDGCA